MVRTEQGLGHGVAQQSDALICKTQKQTEDAAIVASSRGAMRQERKDTRRRTRKTDTQKHRQTLCPLMHQK